MVLFKAGFVMNDGMMACFTSITQIYAEDKCWVHKLMLLLLAGLINRQVEVFCGFGRHSPYRFFCQCGRLRRAVSVARRGWICGCNPYNWPPVWTVLG